jgi:hypothetical protein
MVLMPDADETPEDLLGMTPRLEPKEQIGLRFAMTGFRMLIPAPVNRSSFVGLSGEDDAARMTRENAQFAINEGRTVWQCNECSDPACEHKLFSGLLAQRSG